MQWYVVCTVVPLDLTGSVSAITVFPWDSHDSRDRIDIDRH